MKRIIFFLFFIGVACFPFFAETRGSEIVPSDHWIYDGLRYLAVETGETTFGVNSPASYNEMRLYFDSLRYDELSPQGKSVYHKIQDKIGSFEPVLTTGEATLDIRPIVSATARYAVQSEERYDTGSIENVKSIAEFNETHPFLSLPFTFTFSPAVTAFADFSIGEGYWSSLLSENYTNVPTSADSFEMNIPSTAYVSTGNSFFTAVIGRGSLNTGKTLSGSMILSDNADRLNYASLVFFSPCLRISLTPVELSPNRYVYYHDISIRPFPFLTISASEAASVNSTLDLRYLNPVMIYHSYAGWRDGDSYKTPSASPVGTQFALSAELVPLRRLRIYGQFVMNQFQTTYELEKFTGSDAVPNSLGGLAGLEYIHPFGEGYLSGTLEGVYTNPWLYILGNHAISFYWSRTELVTPSGFYSRKIQGWLGAPYGPDTIACIAQFLYDVPLSRKYSLEYRFVCKGSNAQPFLNTPVDNYYPTTIAEATVKTPSAGALYQNTLLFSLSYFILNQLEISSKVSYSLNSGWNRDNSFDTSATVTWYVR